MALFAGVSAPCARAGRAPAWYSAGVKPAEPQQAADPQDNQSQQPGKSKQPPEQKSSGPTQQPGSDQAGQPGKQQPSNQGKQPNQQLQLETVPEAPQQPAPPEQQ